MQLQVFVDNRSTDKNIKYGFGPDGNILVLIENKNGLQNHTYKLLNAANLPIVEILNWPLHFGVVQRPEPPGMSLIFIVLDTWTDEVRTFHFLDDQLNLSNRADALKQMALNAPDYVDSVPDWAQIYLSNYLAL